MKDGRRSVHTRTAETGKDGNLRRLHLTALLRTRTDGLIKAEIIRLTVQVLRPFGEEGELERSELMIVLKNARIRVLVFDIFNVLHQSTARAEAVNIKKVINTPQEHQWH